MAVDLVIAAKRSFEAGMLDVAWAQVNVALNAQWERPDALYVAGLVLRERGDVAMAAHMFRRALAIEREKVNLWMHYGSCLHDMHLYDDARQVFELVHAQIPMDPQPIANIASGYVQQGRLREAINKADEALAISPDNTIARIAKGYGCLGLGRWRDAWKHAEALYGEHVAVRVYNKRNEEEPEWDGTPGKTVVVTADQGVGDVIMFSQCLLQMQADCKRVIFEVAPRMERMFRRSFPGVHVYGTLGRDNPHWIDDYRIDARINVSLLGKYYRRDDREFPRTAYLVADEDRRAQWLEWLSQFPRPWVGLAWEGGLVNTMKHMRSFPLETYAPIMEQGGTFIDLTYRDCRAEIARWNIEHPHAQVVHPYVDITNYDDTVALVAALDEVYTVTTALAHVCGSLGRTASVMVPEVAQWRYQYRCGDGMIWYPQDSVRLYRQKPGEIGWGPTVARAARDRTQLLKAA